MLFAVAAGALTTAVMAPPTPTVGAQGVGQGGVKQTATPMKPLQILQERVDTDKFQKMTALKDALKTLQDELAGRGMELDIIVDVDVFKMENPDAPDIYETRVFLPPLPRKLTGSMLLRQILNKVDTKNAAFVVFGDHVLITTVERTGPESLLLQHVVAVYEKKPLGQVLRDLAEKTGVSITLDRRAGDKEEYLVSAAFQRDATLAGALRVVTEMADLKVLLLDGMVYVTTHDHAEQLRKEQIQQEKDRHILWPLSKHLDPRSADPSSLPAIGGGLALAGPGLPGFPGAPGPGLGSEPPSPPIPVDAGATSSRKKPE